MSYFRPAALTPSRDALLEEVWFRLMHLRGVGNKALWQIGLQCGEKPLSGDFEQDSLHLLQGPLSDKAAELKEVYKDLKLREHWQQLQTKNIGLLHPQHPLLQRLFLPLQADGVYRSYLPAVLYYWGSAQDILSTPRVGIVGARAASPYILEQSEALAATLTKAGKCVLSGYARGVDTYAHAGAINSGGRTVAVLPHGISGLFRGSGLYPQLKRHLSSLLQQDQWSEQLLFLSQFYPNSRWQTQRYILRNYTICALSQKIVIMAAEHERSGSYQTGIIAQQIGIPLYVFMPKKKSEESLGNQLLCKQKNAISLDETSLISTLSL